MESYNSFKQWREKVFEEGLKTAERNFSRRSLFRAFLSELMEIKFLLLEIPKLSDEEKTLQTKKFTEELADALNFTGFLVARYKNPLDPSNESGKINVGLANLLFARDYYHSKAELPNFSLSKDENENYEWFMKMISSHIRQTTKNYFDDVKKIDEKLTEESVKIENFMKKYDEEMLAKLPADKNPYSEVVDSLHLIFINLISYAFLFDGLNVEDIFKKGMEKIETRSKEYESGKRKLQ
jgi:hypothetical protein